MMHRMPDDPATSGPVKLEYALGPRRRRIGRWIAGALVVVGIAAAAYMGRATITIRVQQAYWFYQCMKSVTPPQTPLTVKPLLERNSPDYVRVGYSPNVPPGVPQPKPAPNINYFYNYSMYVPPKLRELEKYV